MDATALRAFLDERYNDAELRALAFDLRIPYEDLGATDSGKTARVQALIEWCNRRGRYDDLEQAATRARTVAQPGRWPSAEMTEWGPAGQIERLIRNMDELREDVTELVTKVEVLTQRLAMFEKHMDRLAEHPQAVPWQQWAIAIIGLLTAVALVWAMGLLVFRTQ